MKPVLTNFNAFDYRFPRSYKEATGNDYEPNIISSKQKRQHIWTATKVSIGIAVPLLAWLTYSLHTL
jgi:hypothetical protein